MGEKHLGLKLVREFISPSPKRNRTPPKPTHCYEPGCENPPGGWRSPYWCVEHDKQRIERITKSLDAIVADMEAALSPAPTEEGG